MAAAPYRQTSPATTPQARLALLAPDELDALVMSEADRDRLIRKGPHSLSMVAAVALARALGGWLEWLVGLDTKPGKPRADGADVETAALRVAAKDAGVRMTGCGESPRSTPGAGGRCSVGGGR